MNDLFSGSKRKYFPILFLAAAGFLLAFYLFGNAERYRNLLNLSIGMVSAIVILTVTGIVFSGLVNFLLYRRLGAWISFNEAVGLSAVNTLANLLPFAAGMVTKGVYLKKRFQLAYSHYFSTTLALYLIFLSSAGIVGFFILIGRWLLASEPASPLLLLGFGMMAASIATLWLPIRKMPLPPKWEGRMLQIIEGWQILGQHKLLILNIIILYLFMMVSISGRYWIAFRALSQEVTFDECILFAAASILTQLVSLSPGGLGVLEGIIAAVAAVHGIPPHISIVAVGLDRLVATTVVATIGTVYSYYLGRKAIEKVDALSPTEKAK